LQLRRSHALLTPPVVGNHGVWVGVYALLSGLTLLMRRHFREAFAAFVVPLTHCGCLPTGQGCLRKRNAAPCLKREENAMSEIEESLKRISAHEGVLGVAILDDSGKLAR
jgi:hypothetical protein